MNNRLALFVSVLFHPVFVNLLAFYTLIRLSPYLDYALTPAAKTFYIVWLFAATAVVPLLYVLILKIFGKVSSILLYESEERRAPYMLTALMYLISFYFFQKLHSPALINAFMLGSASIVVALLVVNLFNKISIHLASFGMLAAVIISAADAGNMDVRFLLMLLLPVAGLTATARLYAEAHNAQQLLSGFITGFAIMFFIL